MHLNESKTEHSYIINAISLPLETKRRLEALGMMPGTKLKILNTKSHGTLILKVRGTRFALGRGLSEHIKVCEIEDTEVTGQ